MSYLEVISTATFALLVCEVLWWFSVVVVARRLVKEMKEV